MSEIDPNTTPSPAGPTPAVDPEVLKGIVADSVRLYMEANPPTTPDPVIPGYGPPLPTENPLRAVIAPIIEPELRKVGIVASAARDTSLFYATHPEALEHQAEIEKMFNGAIEQGTPFTHDTVWNYFKGMHQDKFVQKAIDAEKAKLKAAEDIETIPGTTRPAGGHAKDAHAATDEELAAGLKDATF